MSCIVHTTTADIAAKREESLVTIFGGLKSIGIILIRSFVKTTKINTVIEKNQIDVIAEKYGKKIVIECKKWKKNNSTKIKEEIIKQKKRMKIIEANNGIIVLLNDFKEQEIDGIQIIPLNKLNNYLNLE